ncbi:MAG: hypothetical protein GU356_01290 [Pyrobaculum sp.]|jgi:hypothetical protein|nr:hypothetical protein [Pyrobaculum sp.]
MRGQVLIGVAALIFVITLLLLIALPKRTIGPTAAIENYTVAKREVEHILRNAAEEAAYATANTLEAVLKNTENLPDTLKKLYTQHFNVLFTDKVGAYAVLRGVFCKLDTLDVKVSSGNNYFYISSIYAVATCDNGVMAFINSAADVKVELKNLGAFGGVKAAVNLTRDQKQIQLITYAAALYDVTGGKPYRFPILGTFDPRESIWYFNITGLHYIQVAIPPEYCMMSDPTYYVAIAAASVGEGAATVVVAKPGGKLCGR